MVGVQEPEGNLRRIADAAGMAYVDESLHLIARHPIFAAERGGIRFGYVAPLPGKVAAIASVHLPSSPCARPSGRIELTSADLGRLAPGRYVAGLFLDDGYARLARTSFRVSR